MRANYENTMINIARWQSFEGNHEVFKGRGAMGQKHGSREVFLDRRRVRICCDTGARARRFLLGLATFPRGVSFVKRLGRACPPSVVGPNQLIVSRACQNKQYRREENYHSDEG
jgi:hypothetical protein